MQVDRRRRTEIQDLADDVGRQERERRSGKPGRQFLAQDTDIFRRRAMAFLQLDLDVAVLRADGAGVVVGHVDARDRHPDIIDHRRQFVRRNNLADRLLDFDKMIGGFLDACADPGPRVHQDLPRIHGWKEVAAQKRRKRKRAEHEDEEADHEDGAAAKRQRE